MSENSAIEWCDHTFNPWMGCTKVGPGCDHCYAETLMDTRYGKVKWGVGQDRVRTAPANWARVSHWNRQPFVECMACRWRGELRRARVVENPAGFHPPVARASLCPSCNEPMLKEARARVFCASLADVFDNAVDPAWRADLWALINSTPNLDWLLLTKRIGNASNMISEALAALWKAQGFPELGKADSWPWFNVWIGATVVNQEEADRDIPKLNDVPATVRFLSMEPLLGPVDIGWGWLWGTGSRNGIDWVIAGGESGPGARPMHPDWARSLRDQCADAGVPFLFKQWGEWAPYGRSRVDRDAFLDEPMQHFGKKIAGRLLDGVQHDGFPA